MPSGCGMADTPMNEPSLMSASDDLTIAAIRGGSASFTVAFWPSRNLTESVVPSTLVISPRTRTGGRLLRPRPTEAEAISARPAAPSARRVIVCMSFLPEECGPAGAGARMEMSRSAVTPRSGTYSLYLIRSASISDRSSGVTSGRTPNQS